MSFSLRCGKVSELYLNAKKRRNESMMIKAYFFSFGNARYILRHKTKKRTMGSNSCAIINTHGIVAKKISDFVRLSGKYCLVKAIIENVIIATPIIRTVGQKAGGMVCKIKRGVPFISCKEKSG